MSHRHKVKESPSESVKCGFSRKCLLRSRSRPAVIPSKTNERQTASAAKPTNFCHRQPATTTQPQMSASPRENGSFPSGPHNSMPVQRVQIKPTATAIFAALALILLGCMVINSVANVAASNPRQRSKPYPIRSPVQHFAAATNSSQLLNPHRSEKGAGVPHNRRNSLYYSIILGSVSLGDRGQISRNEPQRETCSNTSCRAG